MIGPLCPLVVTGHEVVQGVGVRAAPKVRAMTTRRRAKYKKAKDGLGCRSSVEKVAFCDLCCVVGEALSLSPSLVVCFPF